MKKYFLCTLCLITVATVVTGCAKTARYSPEEIKDYPPAIQEQIERGEVSLGMTTQQVRYAWGSPSTINVISPSEDGKPREEWIYSKGGLVFIYLDKRLLFVNGRLVDIYPEQKGSAQPEGSKAPEGGAR